METKKIIKSYENLSQELKDLLKEKYPYGYANKLIRLTNAKGETYFAVPLEAEDGSYLVKVPLEKPKKKSNNDDEDIFSNDNENDGDDLEDDDDNEDKFKSGTDPSYDPDFEEL